MASVAPSALVLWFLLLFSSSPFSAICSASQFSLVVSGPTTLQLYPSLIVEKSPGSKPGTKVKCDRVQIHGLPRIKHWKKFANLAKVKVSFVNPYGRTPIVEICFHRNVSLGIGMCPQGHWERLTNGSWVKPMSPFDHKLLDIRMAASYSESLQVSLDEEFVLYLILFLVLGVVLMTLASWLSASLVFYYTGAMAVGVFLVILMVLFQGMKLLPTGWKSSLGIVLYSVFVGLGSFLLSYVPRLMRSLLVEIGLPEDLYNPLAIFLLLSLVITGAWLGFWAVHKFVLTEDGSIDIGVSHFVTWSIRVVASVMILQSSTDPLLAAEALLGGIFVSSVLMRIRYSKVVHRIYKRLSRLPKNNQRKKVDPYSSPFNTSSSPRPFTRAQYTPVQGSTSKTTPKKLTDAETFYSTFHETQDRRKLSKDEWDLFTKESTRKALEGLVSSPDFSKWAVTHADRITLAPKKEIADKQQQRWFNWF